MPLHRFLSRISMLYIGHARPGTSAILISAAACAFAISLFLATASPATETGSGLRFVDERQSSGIKFIENNSATPEKHQIETMTGGVAAFDFNNDGRPDLYFINGASLPDMRKSSGAFWNRLYRNDGNGRFTDVTAQAGVKGSGYSMGVAVADFDNDGFEDIFISGANANQLLRNKGDGTFEDVTAKAGVTGIDSAGKKMLSVGAGWFDFNNDGLLDLLVVNYVRWSIETERPCRSNNLRAYCSPESFEGLPNTLYRNNGDGTFTDVSLESGIGKAIGKGMSVAFADYDGDGWTDIFIANDTFRNFLFHNNGAGAFTEAGVLAGVAYNENGKSIAGMGADFRDFDGDGKPDIFVTGTLGDTFPLFQNAARGFNDVTSGLGLAPLTVNLTGWSNAIADFDNDGSPELFTANSAILDNSEIVDNRPYKLVNTIFKLAKPNRFQRVNIGAPAAHRGAAVADFDGDGRLDIAVNCLNGPPELLMNRGVGTNHWLALKLRGTKSNRDGLGTRVEVVYAGRHLFNHATTSVGYGSASDRLVHFGLGTAVRAETVVLWWPSGRKQTIQNMSADRVIEVTEP